MMRVFELDIELEDDASLPDALVIVYRTPRGLESSFRVFPETPVSMDDCAAAAKAAIEAFEKST